jgi:Zn-dependent protease
VTEPPAATAPPPPEPPGPPGISPAQPTPPRAKGIGAAIGGIALLLLAKAKVLLVALKALKFGKILLTMGTMVITIGYYAMQGGWRFAVGFVLMILIHEIGHGVEIKRAGLESGYPIFIPFFGALISMKGQPRSPAVEARIALAGPMWGGMASVGVAALYLLTHERLWLTLAYTGFFLNLFNLTPLGFLDGGRVTRLFSRRAWIVGVGIFVVLFILAPAPQVLIIGILALMQALNRAPVDPQAVTARERLTVAASYFGLCAALAAGTAFSRMLLGD